MRCATTKPKAAYSTADLERDLDRQFGPNAVARGREVFAATCARCHSSIPETAGGAFKNRDFRAAGPNGRARRLDGLGPGDAGVRGRHQPLPCAALESHERPHLGGVRLRDAARARARSQHQGAARRRPRLLPQHLAAFGVGARAASCTTTRIGPELCGKPANKANDFYRSPYVDANGKTLPPTRRRPAGRTTRASTGASSSTSPRWRNCSIPASACPRCRASIRTCASRSDPRTWDGKEEKQVFGFTRRAARGHQRRRHGELPAQGLRQRHHPGQVAAR